MSQSPRPPLHQVFPPLPVLNPWQYQQIALLQQWIDALDAEMEEAGIDEDQLRIPPLFKSPAPWSLQLPSYWGSPPPCPSVEDAA